MIRIIFLGIVIYIIYFVLKSIFGNKNSRRDYDQGSRHQSDIVTDEVKEEIRARQSTHNDGNPARAIPSWMNTDQVHAFDSAVFRILRQDGISLDDAKRLMNHRKTYMAALYVAGNLEQKGATFVQQQLAAGDALIALWRRSNHSQLFADDDF